MSTDETASSNDIKVNLSTLEQIAQELLKSFGDNFTEFTFSTDFQRASFAMLRRSCIQIRALHLLIKKKFAADAVIILRSLLNLYWLFLFMCNAKYRKRGKRKGWSFNERPRRGSPQFKRAARFIGWFFVNRYRDGQRDRRTINEVNQLVQYLGLKSVKDLRRHWWNESGVRHIRHFAKRIGAIKQYKIDYDYLSRIEHGGIESLILIGDNFSQPESKYAIFNLFKAIHLLSQMLCFTILITGRKISPNLQAIVDKLDLLSKQIYDSLGPTQKINSVPDL